MRQIFLEMVLRLIGPSGSTEGLLRPVVLGGSIGRMLSRVLVDLADVPGLLDALHYGFHPRPAVIA